MLAAGFDQACLHCWHSDPDTSGKSRWFCCRDKCGVKCIQNYLDVRKCKHCNLRMLVDEWGFCGICGQFVMSWIFERTLADTLKPNQAAIVEEYLSVRKLPNLAEVRAQLNTFKNSENRHVSAHGHMRLGHGGRSSSKILNRKGGRHHRPNGRKQGDSFYRRVNFVDEPIMPAEEFWRLFEQIKDQVPTANQIRTLADHATPEQIGVVQFMNSQAAERQRKPKQPVRPSLTNALAETEWQKIETEWEHVEDARTAGN